MFLINAYESVTDALVAEDTPWYKQPWFILAGVLVGVAAAAYVYFLKRRMEKLRMEKHAARTEATRYKSLMRQTKHKKEIAKLEQHAKQAETRANRLRKKLESMADKHRRFEDTIDKAETFAGLQEAQDQIERQSLD